MDFSVRQARECLEGDMIVIRFAFKYLIARIQLLFQSPDHATH